MQSNRDKLILLRFSLSSFSNTRHSKVAPLNFNFMKRYVSVGLCGLVMLLSGCGSADSGPERFDISGTVSFKGKPVHRGTIVFSPDQSKGNSGPQGAAEISEGKYDTSVKGKGLVGGDHIITIIGFDKVDENAKPEVSSDGMVKPQPPLFPTYTIKKDLPQSSTTLDIEVPGK